MTASREEGFTLIEMIVALAILGIALATLLAAFSQGLERQRYERTQTRARWLAESVLQTARAESRLAPGVTQGAAADGMRWVLTVAPYGSAADRKAWAFAPVRLIAEVDWTLDGRNHRLSVATLGAPSGEPAR
jgi:general secretion pathway protein I